MVAQDPFVAEVKVEVCKRGRGCEQCSRGKKPTKVNKSTRGRYLALGRGKMKQGER